MSLYFFWNLISLIFQILQDRMLDVAFGQTLVEVRFLNSEEILFIVKFLSLLHKCNIWFFMDHVLSVLVSQLLNIEDQENILYTCICKHASLISMLYGRTCEIRFFFLHS